MARSESDDDRKPRHKPFKPRIGDMPEQDRHIPWGVYPGGGTIRGALPGTIPALPPNLGDFLPPEPGQGTNNSDIIDAIIRRLQENGGGFTPAPQGVHDIPGFTPAPGGLSLPGYTPFPVRPSLDANTYGEFKPRDFPGETVGGGGQELPPTTTGIGEDWFPEVGRGSIWRGMYPTPGSYDNNTIDPMAEAIRRRLMRGIF